MRFANKLNKALNNVSIHEAISRRVPKEMQMPDGLSPEDQKEWRKKQRKFFKEKDEGAMAIAKRIATKIPPGGNAQDLALAIGLIPKSAGAKAFRRPDKDYGQPIALTDIAPEEVRAHTEAYPIYIADHPEVDGDRFLVSVQNKIIDLSAKMLKKGATDIPAQMASTLNMIGKGVEKFGATNFVRNVLRSYGANWKEHQKGGRDVANKRGMAEPVTIFEVDINPEPIEMDDKDASMKSPPKKGKSTSIKQSEENSSAIDFINDLLS